MSTEYLTWKMGQRLLDVDVTPHRPCVLRVKRGDVLTREESSTERPRIGVKYLDGAEEELSATHPHHYKKLGEENG